jgi:hypothetical protein
MILTYLDVVVQLDVYVRVDVVRLDAVQILMSVNSRLKFCTYVDADLLSKSKRPKRPRRGARHGSPDAKRTRQAMHEHGCMLRVRKPHARHNQQAMHGA